MTHPYFESELCVGVVGHGFMARAHTHAWRTAPQAFRLPITAVVSAIAGRDAQRTSEAAGSLGIPRAVTDWLELIHSPDIDVIDICTPVDSHAEIATAALEAGKHVLCEKPLALSLDQAQSVARAAEGRGVVSMLGFNYRRIPALALARRLCQDGTIGRPRHVRARYLQDWLADDTTPWSWRLDAEQAGAGALADLGSHLIDLVHFALGEQLLRVAGQARTFVPARADPSTGRARPVTVDDACTFSGCGRDDLLVTFEVSRVAHGHKNHLTFEVDGDLGALAFDLERLNELQVYSPTNPADLDGFRRVMVTEPSHPYIDAWWPPGHVLGWEHSFVHQARDFLQAVADHVPASPSFQEGAYVQAVIEAVRDSTGTGSWQPVDATVLRAVA